jgi:hypothetical protein
MPSRAGRECAATMGTAVLLLAGVKKKGILHQRNTVQ